MVGKGEKNKIKFVGEMNAECFGWLPKTHFKTKKLSVRKWKLYTSKKGDTQRTDQMD